MLGAGVSPSAGYSEQRAVKLQVETIVDGKAEDQVVTSIPFCPVPTECVEVVSLQICNYILIRLNTLLNGCKAVIPIWALLLQLLLGSASLFCTTERVTKPR